MYNYSVDFHVILWGEITSACKPKLFLLRTEVLCAAKHEWEVAGNLNAFLLAGVCLQNVLDPSPDDTLISFLPLAHMFERVVEVGP